MTAETTPPKNDFIPIVTYTLIGLNVLIFLWDRDGHIFGQRSQFVDLALKPSQIVAAVRGTGDRSALTSIFTSMFLHGNLGHLFANMLFLFTFGEAIEEALGPVKYAFYYLFWGIFAAAAHVAVLPHSYVPMVGASGAIGGILGCFFLLFPTNKVSVFFLFFSVDVAAWILLGLWFLSQIFMPGSGVANWAHVGGFLAGMLTVLVLGGREKVLKDSPLLEDELLPA